MTTINGVIDTRIQGETSNQGRLTDQIDAMEARLSIREKLLKSQFAAMENAMSQSQSLQSSLLASMSFPSR